MNNSYSELNREKIPVTTSPTQNLEEMLTSVLRYSTVQLRSYTCPGPAESLEATCHTQHHKHNHRAQSWCV